MEAERKIIQVEGTGPLNSKKKKRGTLIAIIIITAIAAGVSGYLFFMSGPDIKTIGDYTVAKVMNGTLTLSTEASGTIVLPTQISIVSPEEGYASDILVNEGDSVTPDDVLAVIEVPDLEDKRDDLLTELITARITLEELNLDNEYEVKDLETALTRLQDKVREAEEDAASMKALAELKSSRQSDYETAQDVLEDLKDQLEDTGTSLEKQRKQGDISLRKQEAVINQLEVSLERTLEDLEAARIKSPISGEVLSLNEDLTVPGSLIEMNEALFIVADTGNAYIDLEVYEQYSGDLEIGDEMDVTISSNTIKAHITQIGKIASLSSDGLAATVTVRAKPGESVSLTPGASAVAEIPLGTKEDVLLLPRGSYLTTGNQKYAYKVEGDTAYKTSVTFGEIQGTEVEILKGLEKGDQIIISSYQNFIDQDAVQLESN